MAKEKRKSRGMDWEDVPPIQEGKKFDAGIETFNFNDTSHTQIRLIGQVYQVKMHWVPTIRKDGSRGQFPKLCLHNSEDAEMCPYCKAGIRVSTRYFSNAIIRDLEESRPRKAKYDPDAEFKKPGDKNWTPIRAVAFPASVMQKIMNFKSLTKIKTKNGVETFHVSHPKYGRDLNVKLDPNGTGSGIYDVQREEVSKLEGEEKEYLRYDLDTIYDAIETEEEALATLRSCFDRGTFEGAKDKSGTPLVNVAAVQKMLGVSSKHKDEDDDDEDDTPKKKKRGNKRPKDEDYDEDIEEDDDLEEDEDDDEEESSKSKKSKKSKKSSKKRSKDKDDDDDDDLEEDDEDLEDEDDEDEDEEEEKSSKSKKSKKSKKSSKSKKRSSRDDDDEDDDELEDEDDDEDEEEEESSKSRKSKKSSKSKKRSKDEDEDDDDEDLEEDDEDLEEDDEDEDEEEESSKSKKSKKSSKSKKSKKRSKRDDDDEDDDLEDEDEDEDDEPKSKKSKKSKKKSRR